MTFDGIRRLSPYWSLALCYGVVTAVGLIPGLLYGNEFAYWLLGFWLILAIVLPLAAFRSTEMQSLFYGLVPSLVGLTLGVLVRKFVFWYRNRQRHF